jgi:fumarate hydratase subunit beta
MPAAPSPLSLTAPLGKEEILRLRAGDQVLLSGTVYAARDSAHRRMLQSLEQGGKLPFEPEGAVVYYVGPTPPLPGMAVGSAGPTTSGRMDPYAPRLHALGLAATIGKGRRNGAVREALRRYGAVCFGATGGAAALLSRHITEAEIIAYPDLGTEAVRRLVLRDFPLLVLYDAHGGDAFPPVLREC